MSKHLIKEQSTHVIKYNENDLSVDAYQNFTDTHDGKESVLANPDQLEDTPVNNFFSDKSDKSMAQILISRFLDEDGNFPTLSPKENQVLRLYTAGLNDYEIAKDLHISRRTIRKYLERSSKKLKLLLNSVKGIEF
jgi:ATP/maltotriose-dependent transcriptional regulator MalT